VQFDKRITKIECSVQDATAFFEDGSKERANLVVGADGARSVVRHILLGPEKAALHMSRVVATSCLAKLPEESAQLLANKNPRFFSAITPGGDLAWFAGEPLASQELTLLTLSLQFMLGIMILHLERGFT
jgi:2-polyprenyl-6-methoxyphenol hydroxylase-like FAD-dependent oxidoreductase